MTELDRSHGTVTRGTRRRRSRRLMVAFAALVSTIALMVGGPTGTALGDENDEDKKKASTEAKVLAEAPAYTPNSHTTFNNPKSSTASQRKIIDELNRYIDNTPNGGTIRFVAYLFDATTTAAALVRAHDQRNVKIQLLIDDGENSPALVQVRNAVADSKNGSWVKKCSNGCHTDSPSIIHSKIFTFSQVGNAKWVSVVGSANPWYHNVFNSWNNMQTVVGNQTIYNSLNSYINEMLVNKDGRDAYKTTSSGNYKLYFFPKLSGDPMILEVLQGVKCTGATGGYGSGGRTVVRIAMWGWATAREDIAKQLNTLHQRGCIVQVLLNKDRTSKTVFAALLKSSSKYGKIDVYDGWYDSNDDGEASLYVHHKALMINGNWFSDSSTKVVYTGSQNYTHEGLRKNNEVVMRIKTDSVYNAFYNNFAYIRNNYTKGKITSVPSFVGERSASTLRAKAGEEQPEIEALTQDPGWYVPPGEVADQG